MCARNANKKQKISMLLTLKNIQEIKDYHTLGVFPSFKSRFQKRDFKKKAKMFITTSNGMLMREVNSAFLMAVGNDDIDRIHRVCRYAHDKSGHCKVGSSWKKIRMHWMGFKKKHLLDWISKCSVCLQESQQPVKKEKSRHPKAASKQVTACFSMERLQMDCISMAEYAVFNKDYSYILHIMDVYSRYHFACPLRRKNTGEISRCLLQLFEKNGWPHILQSEADKVFVSDELSSLLRSNKVLHVYPSAAQDAQALMIIKKSREVLKKKIMRLMKEKGCGYSWISVLSDTISQWNNEYLGAIMAKPSSLFPTMPPNIDYYMQTVTNLALPKYF